MNKVCTILDLLQENKTGLTALQIAAELDFENIEALRVYLSLLAKLKRIHAVSREGCTKCGHAAIRYGITLIGKKYLADRTLNE